MTYLGVLGVSCLGLCLFSAMYPVLSEKITTLRIRFARHIAALTYSDKIYRPTDHQFGASSQPSFSYQLVIVLTPQGSIMKFKT